MKSKKCFLSLVHAMFSLVLGLYASLEVCLVLDAGISGACLGFLISPYLVGVATMPLLRAAQVAIWSRRVEGQVEVPRAVEMFA
tara:strand:+ start:51 stop:302 length:252 start_codon:yes stop_codon:yes gene_type:complete